MKICPTQKIYVARGRNTALCPETLQGDTTSGGRHDDVFPPRDVSRPITFRYSLDQSYFFIRRIPP